ncbi:unnamed protein product [Orchesella dallaii]|uniref:Chorion peroxidase n=1 Tax=Orchesella dallaii TaxID=48710 RepID=A0ABP1RWV7_9HEXA
MGPTKWILIFLLVATASTNAQLGEQGGGGGSVDFPQDTSGSFRMAPPLTAYFLEDEELESIIIENPDADDYPEPDDDPEEILNRFPRAASYQPQYSSKPQQSYSYSHQNYKDSSSSHSSSSYYNTKCSGPEGLPGCCKPLALCGQYYGTAVHYKAETSNYYKSCTYGYGYQGVCCPDIGYSGSASLIINYDPKRYGGYDGKYVNIPQYGIKQALQHAIAYHDRYYRHDQHLGRDEDDPSYWGNGVVQDLYMDEVKDLGDLGAILAIATKYASKTYGYKPESYYDGGLKISDYGHYLPAKYREICDSFDLKCYPSKYRTIDGSCNNLKYPTVGKAYSGMGYIRIPRYSDSVYQPRYGSDHKPLHKVRPMRYTALPDKDMADKSVNMLFVTYGQLVAHDVSHVPFYQSEDGKFIDCCDGYKMGDQEVSEKCYAIALPPDDGFYKSHRRESLDCLNFARSVIAPNYQCTLGYTTKLNRQTHFHDCSIMYGISHNETDKVRLKKYGMLKFSKVGHQQFLPIDKDAECFNSSSDFCFSSGDLRTTLQPGVLVGQTVMMKLHNYIAKKLYRLNPHWNDDKLFYEARAITTAIFQHITYTEYLPLLLGWRFMYDYGILPPSKGYSYDYDPEVKPWTFHEFAGAAFRHHSSIYGKIVLADEYYKAEKSLPLEEYYNSGIILKNPYNYEKIIRGFMIVPQRKIDKYYDASVSDLLLKNNRTFGLDLPTFNVKRGRDFGIGSYNDFRELCGLKRAYSWKDFYDVIDPDIVAELAKFYRYPDDLDLYTGGVVERHIKDSYIGPTWWCIVGHQFQTWKRGDRFFYTHGGMPHSFTEAQLDEIRKMSMAAVLCSATSYLKTVPTFAFRTIATGNPLVSCDDYNSLPRLSLAPWKDY